MPDITEKEFLRQVADLGRLFGWRTYHPWLSIHSERGWPDVAMVRPPPLVLAELKTDKGKATPSHADALSLEDASESPGRSHFGG